MNNDRNSMSDSVYESANDVGGNGNGGPVSIARPLKETPIEPPDDYDDEVVRIAEQAVETHRAGGCRWDTYFYKVVLGGNVSVVQRVAQRMQQKDMRDTLDWLWQRGAYEETSRVDQKKRSSRFRLIRIILFIVFVIGNILLTPVVYIIHIFTCSLLNREQKRISASIKLPLAYAVFSQNTDMMAFFLSQGVDVEHIDKQGNNVFHYISDLSSVAGGTAIDIFIATVQFIDNTELVRDLLMHHRNSAGLTAVEYAAKFGSPSLVTQILKQPNLLQHTPFAVSPDKVSFGDTGKPPVVDANTKLEFVDVTMYEAGALANQSTLLNFLSDRDIAAMSEEDLMVFNDQGLIGKWVALKIKQMMLGVVSFQVIDAVITVILLLVLRDFVTGQGGDTFFAWKMDIDSEVQMEEITAWMGNESYIFKNHAFHRMLNDLRGEEQLMWLRDLTEQEPNKAQLLFRQTFGSTIDPKVYDDTTNTWTVTDTTLSREQLDNLYDVALTMDTLAGNYSELFVFRELSGVLAYFAKDLMLHKSEVFKGLFFMYTDRYKEYYNNFTFPGQNQDIILHEVISHDKMFNSFVCKQKPVFTIDDMRGGDDVDSVILDEIYAMDYMDACYYKGILSVIDKENCDETDPLDLASSIIASQPTTSQVYRGVVGFFIVAYIVLDVIERCIFVRCCMSQQSTVWDMVSTLLGRKIPGSYARKILNMLSYFGIVYQFLIEAFLDKLVDPNSDTSKYLFIKNSGTVLFITAIVVRFLMHIHAMRLLPGIGHFVITTFMMGTDLLHFSVVFGMVLGIFTLLFHILIDDPSCPIQKHDGFGDIMDSLFSTFQLTFGHGEFDAYTASATVKLTYVLYVIIVGLLLMNLIIAIMSATADNIMTDPWKQSLWQVEWLDEATSVEYTFSVLGLLFRGSTCTGYLSHKHAGFVVKQQQPGNEWRIYVENFICTPLK